MDEQATRVRPPAGTIVYVDHDPASRKHVRDNVASRTRHYFEYLDTGEELLRRLESKELRPLPAMFLISLDLPGMPGDKLVGEIRTKHQYLDKSPAIVVTSGDGHDRAKAAAGRAGADLWIGKPITVYAIDAALNEFAPGRFQIEWVDRNAHPHNGYNGNGDVRTRLIALEEEAKHRAAG